MVWGREGTYTRPEEQQSGEEEESSYFVLLERRNLGVVEEVRGGVRVRNISLTDRLSASDRVCYRRRPGPVEKRSEVKGRRRELGEGVVVRGS